MDIDDIDDHYQNTFDFTYKIDDDNFIKVEVDGETIFEGNISKLKINSSNTEQGHDLSLPKQKYISPKLEKIKQIKSFCEFDADEVWVSKENHLLVGHHRAICSLFHHALLLGHCEMKNL